MVSVLYFNVMLEPQRSSFLHSSNGNLSAAYLNDLFNLYRVLVEMEKLVNDGSRLHRF